MIRKLLQDVRVEHPVEAFKYLYGKDKGDAKGIRLQIALKQGGV